MPANSITLAPAAGAGIGKQLAEALLADPEFLPAMKAAAMGGLRAVRSWWDKGEKKMLSEPDSRVQIQALALLLAHMEGMPIQRIIRENIGGPGSGFDLEAELAANPALAEGLRRKLDNSSFRTRNAKRVKPEPASVPPDGKNV